MEFVTGVWRGALTRENIQTMAENKVALYLSVIDTPHNVDAATHARHKQEAEDYVAEYRRHTLPIMIAMLTGEAPPGLVYLSAPLDDTEGEAGPATKRTRTDP